MWWVRRWHHTFRSLFWWAKCTSLPKFPPNCCLYLWHVLIVLVYVAVSTVRLLSIRSAQTIAICMRISSAPSAWVDVFLLWCSCKQKVCSSRSLTIAHSLDRKFKTLLRDLHNNDPRTCVVQIDGIQGDADIAVQQIASAATNNTVLRRLSVRACILTHAGASELAKITTLTSLDLGNTRLGSQSVKAIATLPLLESLKLDDCPYSEITKEDVEAVAMNTAIKSLNLSDGSIAHTFRGIASIIVAHNSTLTSLNLGNCNTLWEEDVITLSKHPSLTSLKLYSNSISDSGATSFAANSTITQLDLSHNPYVTSGTGITLVMTNSVLLDLSLAHTAVGSATASTLLRYNTTLTVVDFDGINLDAQLKADVMQHLAINREKFQRPKILGAQLITALALIVRRQQQAMQHTTREKQCCVCWQQMLVGQCVCTEYCL